MVATAVGSIPELVRDHVDGFLVENDNLDQTVEAIEKLVVDAGLRRSMGESAARRIEEDFNLSNQSRDYLELYRYLLTRKSVSSPWRRSLRMAYGYSRLIGYAAKPLMQTVSSRFRSIARRLALGSD